MSIKVMEVGGFSNAGEASTSVHKGQVNSGNTDAEDVVNGVPGEDNAATAEEEVEALSHKEMRRKKKAEKQAARAGQIEIAANPPIHPSRAATIASANTIVAQNTTDRRSKFSVWVGNLSFRTSSDRLQEWFEQHDIRGILIRLIPRINMPRGQKRQDHNKGFAYVDIPTAEVMQSCIDLSESHLEGRKLLIKAGSDYTGRPEIDEKALELARVANAKDDEGENVVKGKTGLSKTAQKILRAQKHSPGPTLFVGNLSFNTTEQGLREMIERSAMARIQRKAEKKKSTDNDDERERGTQVQEKSKDDGSSDDSESDSDIDEANGDQELSGEHNGTQPIDRAAERERRKEEKAKEKGLRGAGIRKVRMGQFEDTGKCKGFAFIDFFSPAYATASLIDPRNSKLDGRELLLQYAGADAIRRGAPKGQIGGPRPKREGIQPFKRPHREAFEPPVEVVKEILGPAPEIGSFDPDAPLPKKHKETKEERIKRREIQNAMPNRRAKPGAALANTPRGKTGIVVDAPVGIKTTFD